MGRSEVTLRQKHFTKESDKRTPGQCTRLKIFYTVHNLLNFLIAQSFPSPLPCLCLTLPRYFLDFFCASKLLFYSPDSSILLIFSPWCSTSGIGTTNSNTQAASPIPPHILTIGGSFLHRKLVYKLWFKKLKLHWEKLHGKIVKI